MQTEDMEKMSGEMSNRQLFERGLLLTEEIRQLEQNNLNFLTEIEVMNREIKKYHDKAVMDIDKATDDKGKKLYSNETQRMVARRNLLRDSKGYKSVTDNLISMKMSIKINETERDYRKYRLRLINSYMRQTPE